MRWVKSYSLKHYQAALFSLRQLSHAPLNTIMTCMVIGITLALPAILFVALKNIESMNGNLREASQITAYLKLGTRESEAKKLLHHLRSQEIIASVNTISPSQGLKELQKLSGFQGALIDLPENPLPWTFIIMPTSMDQLDELATYLKSIPAIESLQLDKLWVQRLESLMLLGNRTVFALAGFLGIAVLLIINNAIRSATQQSQKEIEIIELIGGTSAFIRRPFLYAGMLYGLLGGIIAWQLVDVLLSLLRGPMVNLIALYNVQYELIGIGFANTLILLGSSMLLGLMGSWFAVTQHLKA